MNLELPYVSKRDECGGIITSEDWNDFIIRLTKMRNWVWRKWALRIKAWKKKGKQLLPWKTLFKPPKRVNLAKNPLWREVFLDNKSEATTEATEFDLDYQKNSDLKGVRRKENNTTTLPPIFKNLESS